MRICDNRIDIQLANGYYHHMVDLNELEATYIESKQACRRLDRQREDRRRALEQEARVRIAAQIDEEFPEWRQANDQATEAQRAFYDARIEDARARLSAMNYGRGVLVEWETKKGQWFSERKNWHYESGRRGTIEVVDRNTQFPDNMADYRRPALGDMIIRLLKKDGTPSKQVINLMNGIPNWWLPEGEKHEKAAPDGQ